MESINVKIINKSDHPTPSYETAASAGMDLRANLAEPILLEPMQRAIVKTGLFIALPPGYEAQIRPRSGLALKHGIGIVNSPGTIDSDYRGEIGIIMINWGLEAFSINRGDRIAQMVITRVCQAKIISVADLDSTKRGKGGFGHSGMN